MWEKKGLIFIFPPWLAHSLPIFGSEIARKLKVNVTEKLWFAQQLFNGRIPAL